MNKEVPWVILGLVVSIVIALLSSVQLGVFAAFFVTLAWWTWHRPHDAVIFFIVLAPLLPMLKITQTIGTVTLLKDVIIVTLFVKLFALPLITRTLPYRRNPFALPIIGLLLWTAIATLRADQLTLGVLRARDIVLYLMLYFAVLYLPYSKEFLVRAARWFMASAAIVMLLAGYQWFFAADSAVLRFDPARSIWIPRISSILAHPSILGHYLAITSTFLFAWAARLLAHRQRGLLSFGMLGALTIVGLLVYLTYSRAVWIGLVLAFSAIATTLAWQHLQQRYQVTWKHVRRVMVGLVLLLAIAGFGIRYTPANTFIQTIFDPTYASNAERLEFAARLIAPMTNAEALVGRGLGDVTAQQFREIDVTSADIATGASQAIREAKDDTLVDNQYLKSFVELGLVGVLLYLWIFFIFMKHSFALVTGHRPPALKILGLWGIGFIIFFVTQGFFIDVWEIFPTNAVFWMVAALLARELAPSESAAVLTPNVD